MTAGLFSQSQALQAGVLDFLAARVVWATQSDWPDLIVALFMATLFFKFLFADFRREENQTHVTGDLCKKRSSY